MFFKRLLFVFFMLLFSVSLSKENETLLGFGEITHSGYGAVEMKFSGLGGNLTAYTGGKGAWVMNNTILLGGGGYGLVSKEIIDYYTTDENLPNEAKVYNSYGGIILGYIHNQNKLIHFSSEVLIGAGNIHYTFQYKDYYNVNRKIEESNYFVIEPSLYVEMNVTSFMVVAVGGSYRFVDGIDLSRTYDIDISGFQGNVGIKFGLF